MSPETNAWVLEYFLRQPDVDERIANELFYSLPLPSPFPVRLHKTLLLRRLAGDLKPASSPSLRSLDTLELIDDLHFEVSASSTTSESMTAAYRAVALHCVAGALRTKFGGNDDGALELVKNMCRRVQHLARARPAVLSAELLTELREELKALLENADARAALVERDTRKEAVGAVEAFLRESEEEMGPSFLEMAAEIVIENKIDLEGDGTQYLSESSDEEEMLEDRGLKDAHDGASASSHSVAEHGDAEKDCTEINKAMPSSSCGVGGFLVPVFFWN